MRVNELASSLAVTPETVRYYARKGLLTPERNPDNGYKEFGLEDQQRLRFIVNARHLGFSVSDIGKILRQADKGESPCPTVRGMIEDKLAETEKRFEEVLALRNRLRRAIVDWQQLPDGKPCGHSICHLIEEFAETDRD